MVEPEEIAHRDDQPVQHMGGRGRILSRHGFRAILAADAFAIARFTLRS